jgi:hypothetical protein
MYNMIYVRGHGMKILASERGGRKKLVTAKNTHARLNGCHMLWRNAPK